MTRHSGSLKSLLILCASLAILVIGLKQSTSGPERLIDGFPPAMVRFTADERNPLFTAAGPGHWDAVIRERGWIMREGDTWHLWYTGYDGTRDGTRLLGYATSPDGITWTRHGDAPLLADVWVEDMQVVKHDGTYYMFAEGRGDRAHLLTSTNRIDWQPQGTLDIRHVDGTPLSDGPFGTPTIWREDGAWHLFYERDDAGIWLATSTDLRTWTNVSDEPLIVPGPEEHDQYMIALNQVLKYRGVYYANYHGTARRGAEWNTNVVRSRDLLHWQKFPGNPVIRNRSSGQMIHDGQRWRMYTTHERVDLYWPAEESPAEESPAEESPAEESPAEESPAEESPAAESHSSLPSAE